MSTLTVGTISEKVTDAGVAVDGVTLKDGGATFTSAVGVTGNTTITSGNLVIGTSGNGIDFSATSDASGQTSELLDDYEEGTWTPTFNTGYSSVTYVSQVGRYTKIGNIVELKFFLQTSSTSASGNLSITGLPFTSGNNSINNNVGIIHVQSNSGTLSTDSPICRLGTNSTTIFIQTQGTTSMNSMAGSELGNGIMNGSITYFTS
tara:strand:+ start:100 stop:714 length:615 start_codon:yes stop_codon:yes gene_type:complete